jgi:hypothetical protein
MTTPWCLFTGFALSLLASAQGTPKTETITGWFSDEGCAKGRVASGVIAPTNPECARTCIENGNRLVFISEQSQQMLYMKDYPVASATQHLGYHIEITGIADADAKTISVASVKRIGEYQGPVCARPKKQKN